MARILSHATVVRDGMHNAFTSAAYFQGAYWVAYRKADQHGRSNLGTACLSVSRDGTRFREVARVKTLTDTRDPTLVPIGDRLAMLVPDRPVDPAKPIQQYIAFSDNGFTWSEPQPILGPDEHLFRVRSHNGRFYGMQITRLAASRVMLTVSDDLLSWQPVSQVGDDEHLLNESDVIFREDGQAWVIARSKRKPDDSFFCRAAPPYKDWTMIDLKRRVHAPLMIEHNGKVYLAGRCDPVAEGMRGWPYGHSLCIWEVRNDGTIDPVLHIPATGDCSYAGFIQDPAGRLLMSYYSQHAYYWGVIPPFTARPEPTRGVVTGDVNMWPAIADVFVAELELP